MAVLERRVQVLFDEELYQRLRAEARAERMSVGALIRDAVAERLDQHKIDARSILDRLWASADAQPMEGALDWEREKDALNERPILRDLP